ncbi:hypothetical protein [Rhizobium sp. SSA_523]|uniref:hypothetical protein n=1 Tax=Rhizobium sp. SSA_523 TaxID=2952477 RepID=UPI00209092DE|nr:hypothetical protein [Rhizobium sp. SSA_523]MCO5733010.1 hypothetical protein [Rhizobium sp. SSA_523]WKC23891.1 hypothetical protein QTJ18_24495 [Rhizobium sp. SSA_523]
MKPLMAEHLDMAGRKTKLGWSSVAFIDDVFRHAFWPAKEFFYELLGAPLTAVMAKAMPQSVRRQMWQAGVLTQAGSALPQGPETQWLQEYAALSPQSTSLLSGYIDPTALHISYEASPGLLQFLDASGVTYIDFRLSPVRFLPDVILAMRSNAPQINQALSQIGLPRHEIVKEATKLSASFRHRDRYTPQPDIPRHPGPQLVVVGQTSSDASIISNGRFFRLGDAMDTLAKQAQGKHVLYLRHPSASADHQDSELALLRTLYPRVEVTRSNSYDLLCCEQPLEFVGLSSGLLQEAAFFGRPTTSLLPPICPLAFPGEPATADGYWQITFDTFMSPEFWQRLLGGEEAHPRETLRNIVPNQLRELHNVWWGYPSHKIKPNDYTKALIGDPRKDLQRIHGAARFILDVVAGPQDQVAGDEVTTRAWRWPNNSVVTLEPDGSIRRDNQTAGTWRRLAQADSLYFLVWNEGYWIDVVRYAGNGHLTCRNNIGDSFVVYEA